MKAYQRTGLCLLLACGIGPAGQGPWELLTSRSARLCAEGKFAEAEAVLQAALEEAERFAPGDIRRVETLHGLGTVYRALGRLPEAEKWYKRSLSAWKENAGNVHSALPKPLISLAGLYLENGLPAKAERLLDPWFRDSIPLVDTADPASVRLLHSFAALQHAQRSHSRAEALYRAALKAAETAFGPIDPEVALILNNLGMLYAQTGRQHQAGTYLERSVAVWSDAVGPDHPDVGRALTNLAAFYCSVAQEAKAEPLFQKALAIVEGSLGPENRLVGKILEEYAVLLRKMKRNSEAKRLESRAQAIRQSHAPEDLGRHTIDFRDLPSSGRNQRSIERERQ